MLQIAENLKDATIMMVDDEPMTMIVVQTFLEEFGFNHFIQVEDSLKVMDILEEQLPDILLLDLIMPGKSGMDILAEIRNHSKMSRLPVVVLTASSDARDKLKALELGATDFLSKPVDQSELGLRIRNTLEAKAYTDQLAYYDPITKLPNSSMFQDRLVWALEKAKRYNENLALFHINLDQFSRINASIGINSSNIVLTLLAERLKEIIRSIDVLSQTSGVINGSLGPYRAEGSGFTLLLNHPKNAEASAVVATRILRKIREPINIEGNEIVVTASIGIATFPEEASNTENLHRLAISAKDYGKSKGGDSFYFSSEGINAIYEKRLKMEFRLRKAIKRNELLLHYQPKVSVQSGIIRGVEALLRWKNDTLGLVSPADFIPLAEETKLIIPIGEWVLQEACNTLVEWKKMGKKPISMAVNVSPLQMEDPDFIHTVKRILSTTRVDPGLLKLEITEGLFLSNIEEKIEQLKALKSLGVTISIDDFGTGYSSLSYLGKLPVDELKIDRSFIVDVVSNDENRAIIASIIYMAHSLQLTTVAEGIETEEQLHFIQTQQCDTYQGFFFSRPVPFADMVKLLP
ncbi:EAL domain-containing protein [Desulforhopalus sp. IMCC35007]|uniref:GGDEF/EAL domain-containing response regulator n=1 Tax=Desulforhopalus sp. IMCC35007 TaxID=2569543 RepID=UPI0010AE54D2|nr:EAL domain-containing protein [Desulforhopalus sp. IMCC35007]TKB11844.1 GGDEF domain-containing response regulator [Desulforhopalus sp. IMCC35007]